MKHLDLFSGIGGFALAVRWMEWETVQFVEIDGFCQKVLNKNFPNVPIHGDIKTFNGSKYRGTIDILTGGFPCQPFSVAGKQNGKEDSRYLWPEMLRVIGEVQPSVIVGENVSGSWKLVDEICSSLEAKGYTTEPIGIDAASVGAPHRRLRYWFVAYSRGFPMFCTVQPKNGKELEGITEIGCEDRKLIKVVPDVSEGFRQWRTMGEPCLVRENDGIPDVLDRLKAVGNAIVPQVAFEIFKAIDYLRYK